MKKCNHPKAPNNLIDGKCGTCIMAAQWRAIKDKRCKPLALKIAKMFESGVIVFDTNGKSLIEWEKLRENLK